MLHLIFSIHKRMVDPLCACGLAESPMSNQDTAAKRLERSELVERLSLMPLALR